MAVSPNPGTEVPCGGRRPSCAGGGATANRLAELLSACKFSPICASAQPVEQYAVPARGRSATTDGAGRSRRQRTESCVSHKPPMDKRCGETLIPALLLARRVGSPSAFLRQSVIKNKTGPDRRASDTFRGLWTRTPSVSSSGQSINGPNQ